MLPSGVISAIVSSRLGLFARDKVNLDLIWLKDDSLEDPGNLPLPEVIAREIVEDLQAALLEFGAVAAALEGSLDAMREVKYDEGGSL